MTLTTQTEQKSFGGIQGVYSHASEATQCDMTFSVYMPESSRSQPSAVVYFLSGLTCTQENVTTKSGFQKYANEHQIAVVCPDTSPRNSNHPSEHDNYDFGSGAGFYLNATKSPWSSNYRMYDYVVEELPKVIAQHFNIDITKAGIFGHSMGGHGALTIGLRNPAQYRSISAFSPIVSPMNCPWGTKAFSNYLGTDKSEWEQYDACKLIESGHKSEQPIFIDQGLADNFLKEQLKPTLFEVACKNNNQALNLRLHAGYDHSYYFIASFMAEHIQFHANILNEPVTEK